MLIRLTRVLGKRAAGLLVVLYGLCVIVPSAAIALGDTARAAHCLTADQHHATGHATRLAPAHDVAPAHIHANGAAHEHGDAHGVGEDSLSVSNCCGLMCLAAIPAAAGESGDEPLLALPAVRKLRQNIAGCGPDLLYRPPITSLSL